MPSQILVSAAINIALVKYWGKKDELNILPLNSSISLTLNQEQVGTRTRVSVVKELEDSCFLLNGKRLPLPQRIKDVLIVSQLRARLSGKSLTSPFVRVESENSIPTAAGLASSASGIAAFAFALKHLYSLSSDCTTIARRGSGSACRSLYGGFVHWSEFTCDSTSLESSASRQIFPSSYWPELKVLICVTNNEVKSVGSTMGMQTSVLTSKLFQNGRVVSAQKHEADILSALQSRDFSLLAEITMRESNQLHAVCLDSWPPLLYLNETSYSLMRFVHAVNAYCKRSMLAYTFDAGPNAFLLAQVPDIPIILKLLTACYGCLPSSGDNVSKSNRKLNIIGIPYDLPNDPIDKDLLESLPNAPGDLLYVISTEVGDGPQIISLE